MISLKNISSAASNKKTYDRGFEYYNERRVLELDVSTDQVSGITEIFASVKGSGSHPYNVEITLDADGKIIDHYCDCPAFYSYEGCCKHTVAVLLQYYYRAVTEERLPARMTNATMTDDVALKMINYYTNRIITTTVSESLTGKVRLVPKLRFDAIGRLSIELNVGTERMYVIKDLLRFYMDMSAGNVVEYGVKLKFLHNENAFDDDSKSLLRFFMSRYRELMVYSDAQISSKNDKRCLFLSPSAFDEFYELYSGKRVAVNFFPGNQDVLFVDGDPRLELSIEKGRGVFKIKMEMPDLLIYGQDRQYIILGDKLYRCGEKYSIATEKLFQAMIENDGEITVADGDMGAFCSSVIPEIREYINISGSREELERFCPKPLTSKLYLDMLSPGFITGNLKFCYDSVEFDAMSDVTLNIQRNLKDEITAHALTKKYFEGYDPEHKFLFIRDEDRIYKLLSEGIDEMSQVMEIYTTDKFKTINLQRMPQISIGVRLRGNLIDIDFDTGELPLDEFVDLLNSYRQKKKYHKLRDGTFVVLEKDSLSDISQLAQGLDLKDSDLRNGRAEVAKYRALYLDGVIKDSARLKSKRDPDFKAMVRDINDIGDLEIEPPQSLRSILRKYQKTGFRWLKIMSRYGFGGVLADDMGLGKTLQTIAFLLSVKEDSEEHMVSLIVCPASLVLNWESEISRFAPQLKTVSILGDARQRAELISEISANDVAITSYDLLKRDIDLYENIEFYCQIIDEAQYIKNAVTQNAKVVKSIKSRQRFALTGTPIENSLAEIWSIFDFLMPGYLHSHNRFKHDFELPIIKNDDEESLSNLKKMLSPFILRRLKSNVLKELPPKTETVLYAGLEGEQRKLYLANLASIRSQLVSQLKSDNIGKTGKVIVLAMLTRLRQLCCDPSLCYDDYRGGSSKLELCMQLLESSVQAGHKVLLFSQFTSMLSIIEEQLKKLDISYYVLKGSTPKEERAALAQSFNTDSTSVFLISLKAGGTGLNLTGADIVIHYDPWWNISAQNQATDRAHRIGQQNSVQVYKLIAKDTIEEKILKLQNEKSKLADSVISEGDGIISKMSPDEILALFDN